MGGVNDIEVKSAEARAVGIDVEPGCVPVAVTPSADNGYIPNDCSYDPGGTGAEDGIISLKTSITNPGGGSYALVPVVEHEMDEILGLGSAFENIDGTRGTETLSNDTVFGVGAPRTFSGSRRPPAAVVSPASTARIRVTRTLRTAPIRARLSRTTTPAMAMILGIGTAPRRRPRFACTGCGGLGGRSAYSNIEVDAMTSIGYTVPEPGTWGMLLVAATALGVARGRARRHRAA